nr:zinc finger, CCHC-type [Tanacetum cinerariifolium]
MGDENHIRTLGDYSRPSHEGYRTTIKLPEGNNMVPLRSGTIQLVQNGYSFHGLWSEDPNQHLKDFLKLVDSLDLGENKKRMRLRLVFEFMASQDARLSKFEADFKQQQSDMTNKINTVLKAITDRIAGTLPSDTVKNPKLGTHPVSSAHPQGTRTLDDEFKDLHLNLPVLEVLAHALINNAILDKYIKSLELGKNGSAFIQGETPAKMGDPGLFTLPCILGDSEPFNTLADLENPINPEPSTDGIGTKPPSYARKDFIDCHLPGEWEISRDVELNPFKDTLVFRRMVEFLGAIPINFKCNMWESEDLIEKPID